MTIEANVNVATRLQFPATVAKDEVSTPDLWDGSYSGSSVWIRPKTIIREADRTGLTVFLDNGHSYDFLVAAAPGVPQSCILIVDYPTVTPTPPVASAPAAPTRSPEEIEAARQAANARASAARAARARASAQQQAALTAKFDQMRRQMEQQANDRIKQFQYSIDTQYAWDGVTRDDQLLVNAVYDDGRFTYVRVTTTAFGLPALSGRLDGKDALLEFDFDDLTGVFTVQGLYDKLRLKLGTHVINIVRKG